MINKNNKLLTKIKLLETYKINSLCSINSEILQIRTRKKMLNKNFTNLLSKFLMNMNKKSENTKNKKIIIQKINLVKK